jgi:thiamine biosynthesis protein ThiC
VYVIEDIEGNGFLNAVEQVKEICADSPFFLLGPANTAFVLIKRG